MRWPKNDHNLELCSANAEGIETDRANQLDPLGTRARASLPQPFRTCGEFMMGRTLKIYVIVVKLVILRTRTYPSYT